MAELILVGFDEAPEAFGFPRCGVCGCWDLDSCYDELFGPCWWILPNLCSTHEDWVP